MIGQLLDVLALLAVVFGPALLVPLVPVPRLAHRTRPPRRARGRHRRDLVVLR